MDDYDDATGEDTARSQPGDSPTDDECRRIGGDATDQRAKLENYYRSEVDVFSVVEGINASVDELEAAYLVIHQ